MGRNEEVSYKDSWEIRKGFERKVIPRGERGEWVKVPASQGKTTLGCSQGFVGGGGSRSNCGVAGPGPGKEENGQAIKDAEDKGKETELGGKVREMQEDWPSGPGVWGTPGGAQGQRTEGGPGKH